MSIKKKNHPEKTWPTQSLRAELAVITVAKRACDWATEVTWTLSYTAWNMAKASTERENKQRLPKLSFSFSFSFSLSVEVEMAEKQEYLWLRLLFMLCQYVILLHD